MEDPLTVMIKAQQAAMLQYWNLTQFMVSCSLRMMEQQFRILEPWTGRRAENFHRVWHPFMLGPDLEDHYGRRAHDVDVEHL